MEIVLVLITINTSMDQEVLNELEKLDGIIDAHFLYGPYDAYALIEAESLKQLQDLVINKIRNIKGIKSTTTCFIAD